QVFDSLRQVRDSLRRPDNRTPGNLHGLGETVQFFQRLNSFSTIAPIPCVNPRYQERERPTFY
ncbi:MAG: hypothetical protein EB075_14735, partial [Bacteroidetes bacterium]|nr:hypothetical protein [Bacteroidota bacterium]